MSKIRYTIRSVPRQVDAALRRLAAETGRTLNSVVLEPLQRGLAISEETTVHHDLDFLIGTWEEDPEFDAVVAELGRVDEELWRGPGLR